MCSVLTCLVTIIDSGCADWTVLTRRWAVSGLLCVRVVHSVVTRVRLTLVFENFVDVAVTVVVLRAVGLSLCPCVRTCMTVLCVVGFGRLMKKTLLKWFPCTNLGGSVRTLPVAVIRNMCLWCLVT